jgi:hypothetical protein
MNLTKLSRDRMTLSASRWTVPREYFDTLYNYLVHGFEPGSFWISALCNDFMAAIQSSHPGNTVEALKNTVGWIRDTFPPESYGDYHRVQEWIRLAPGYRRMSLEAADLIYTEQEEIIKGLRGERSEEPLLY